jgi:hypothetical protein
LWPEAEFDRSENPFRFIRIEKLNKVWPQMRRI